MVIRPPFNRILVFCILVTLTFILTNKYLQYYFPQKYDGPLTKPIYRNFDSIATVINYVNEANSIACNASQELGGVMSAANGMDGQKTICLDGGIAPIPARCLVYSFGINNEWSFDDAIEKFGCKIYAFDPSMNQQDHQRSKGIMFYNMGIGGMDVDKNAQGWKIRTLSSIRKMLGHDNAVIDYLKIDVEDSEWAAFESMFVNGDLKTVKQLAVEIHFFTCDSRVECFRKRAEMLQRIENMGFLRYTSRQNQYSWNTVVIPNRTIALAQELMWINANYKTLLDT